jgi:hypothetical protein
MGHTFNTLSPNYGLSTPLVVGPERSGISPKLSLENGLHPFSLEIRRADQCRRGHQMIKYEISPLLQPLEPQGRNCLLWP